MSCNEISDGLILDKFIVDGYHHDDLPVSWDQNIEEHGVRSQSYPAMDIRRIIVVQDKAADVLDPMSEARKILKQCWNGSWTEQSPMSKCLYDQLRVLYTTQKHFYVQFDNEMSHDPGFCTCPDTKYQAYFTPTYPIRPLGYTPANTGVSHKGNIAIIGAYDKKVSWTINNEIGRILFCMKLSPDNQVVLRYTWRCRVRVAAMSLVPFEINQTLYRGTVTFEQVSPNTSIDPWWPTLDPCNGECNESSGSDFVFSHGNDSAPSVPDKSVPSGSVGSHGSSGSGGSHGSGGSSGSGGSGGSSGTVGSGGSGGSGPSGPTGETDVSTGIGSAEGPPGGAGHGTPVSVGGIIEI